MNKRDMLKTKFTKILGKKEVTFFFVLNYP